MELGFGSPHRTRPARGFGLFTLRTTKSKMPGQETNRHITQCSCPRTNGHITPHIVSRNNRHVTTPTPPSHSTAEPTAAPPTHHIAQRPTRLHAVAYRPLRVCIWSPKPSRELSPFPACLRGTDGVLNVGMEGMAPLPGGTRVWGPCVRFVPEGSTPVQVLM